MLNNVQINLINDENFHESMTCENMEKKNSKINVNQRKK